MNLASEAGIYKIAYKHCSQNTLTKLPEKNRWILLRSENKQYT